MYRIEVYSSEKGKSPFSEWLGKLPTNVRARISARISRFEDGNLGDVKMLGKGLYEARMFFGSGYRLYFTIVNQKVIVLLAGGDKSSQRKDIERAKEYLENYLERKNV